MENNFNYTSKILASENKKKTYEIFEYLFK